MSYVAATPVRPKARRHVRALYWLAGTVVATLVIDRRTNMCYIDYTRPAEVARDHA